MPGAGVLAAWSWLGVLLAVTSSLAATAARQDLLVTRRHPVDVFTIKGGCRREAGCRGSSMGTALSLSADGCTCACAPHLPVFREDLHICVDDLHDCPLIPFISGTTYQKIPYVFLPLKGQIVYPSAELVFAGVNSPICVVSSAKYLSPTGWEDIRNKTDAEPPFRLFLDEGRTFLQWLGESDLRQNLEGRLILVHLMCKDTVEEGNLDNNIFASCVSFRVAGTPSEINPKGGINEVTFSADSNLGSSSGGSSYILIGVSSVLLGLIYIVSVLLYLQGKKRKSRLQGRKGADSDPLTVAEEGIVKNNPLLKHCHENLAYLNDPPSASDSEEPAETCTSTEELKINKVQTSVLIHPCFNIKEKKVQEMAIQVQDTSTIECLPEENVSIVETLDYRDEKPETVKTISCTNGRKKLYFNPAYFEHELLLAPPPAAIEFLTKIREVISIAKAKMEAKRFFPSLMGIPEESEHSIKRACSIAGTESTVILKSDYEKHRITKCESSKHARGMDHNCHQCCHSTEQKQSSIQKWLENISLPRTDDETSSIGSSHKSRRSRKRRPSSRASNSSNGTAKESQQNNNLYENNMISDEKTRNSSNLKMGSSCQNQDNRSEPTTKVKPIKESIKNNNNLPKTNIESNKNVEQTEICYLNLTECDQETQNNNHINMDTINNNDISKSNSERFNSTPNKTKKDNVTLKSNGLRRPQKQDCKVTKNEENKKTTRFEKTKDRFDIILNNNNNLLNIHENKEHDYETIMLNQKTDETLPVANGINQSPGYNLVTEVYVNDGYDYISESSQSNLSSLNSQGSEDDMEYNRNSLGQLTIKVRDNPPPVDCAEDSDSFEPDTLDRKPNKLKINQEINISIPGSQDICIDSLERPPHISLRSSGTFKNNGVSSGFDKQPLNRTFGSLREIFEAKTKFNHCTHNKSIKSCSPPSSTKSFSNDPDLLRSSWRRGKPKLLRAEGKHAQRQRAPSPPNQRTPFSATSPAIPREIQKENAVPSSEKKDIPPLPPRMIRPPLPPKSTLKRSSSNESLPEEQQIYSLLSFSKCKKPQVFEMPPESPEYEPLSSQDYTTFRMCSEPQEINLQLQDKMSNNKIRHRHKGRILYNNKNRPEDSGYLSTDSNDSDVMKCEDSISETDDSFFDGASESGAESIATDSFFFGNIKKRNSK